MKSKIISGIQQIGIGVENLEESWAWYRKYFGMDICVFKERAVAEYMLHYTEGVPRERYAVLAMNMQGGGGFEVWQHTGKKPQPPKEQLSIGDLGINICKMKTADLYQSFEFFEKNKLQLISPILQDPVGIKHFFIKDPYGNIFQFLEDSFVFMTDNKMNGGTYGAVIGVSSIEKSLEVYRDILQYETIVYDKTGVFEDFRSLKGGEKQMRRVLLRHSKDRKGAFAPLMGPTQIELVQVLNESRSSVFEGRMWGDPGYIHLCFDVSGFDALRAECEQKGYPFTVDSTITLDKPFDMGDAAGNFSYISDPDGTPIEFVETRKVPIMKKLGLYIKLYNRNPEKSLPQWMLKALRFQRVK
jgi:catechol 2,3-dioxygenase-like lactoylglutathione lyase family enzyme